MRFRLSAVVLLSLVVATGAQAGGQLRQILGWSLIPLGLVVLGLLILYYVLLVRVTLEMLRRDANKVLLTFSFLALVPAPPFLILGILIIIIWNIHKKTLPEA
ncbi:MAG: hypothetical protein IH849_14565 [Acidobacteria bacterium]|nr:hypothetical protein [Acidobacteriota bacterium]